MKKIIASIFAIMLMAAPAFAFVGCGSSVLPIAYVQFKTEGTQVVRFTSHANSSYPHIYVFDKESDIPVYSEGMQPAEYTRACESACAMYISFKRNVGADTVNGESVIACDINKWYSMSITIWKKSEIYDENKEFYLNDEKLVVGANKNDTYSDHDGFRYYYFEDFVLKRANPNGKINGTINILEYK